MKLEPFVFSTGWYLLIYGLGMLCCLLYLSWICELDGHSPKLKPYEVALGCSFWPIVFVSIMVRGIKVFWKIWFI